MGPFSAGDLGLLDFSTSSEGRIVGKFKKGGACNFRPDREVISGVFEGNVFVGTVMVCQEGPSCEPEHSYPFLGVWHELSLSGDVKLGSSCRSPGLDLKRLNITAATAEEKLQLRPETNSAAVITKPMNRRELQEAIEKSLLLAQKKLKEGDYHAAAQSFERGISYSEENWAAHAGLGVAQMGLKNTDKAIDEFQRALQLTRGIKIPDAQIGDLHYNLACALSRAGKNREALTALSKAVKLLAPGSLVDQLDQDHDLDPLRTEPDFRRMLGDARIARERLNRKRTP